MKKLALLFAGLGLIGTMTGSVAAQMAPEPLSLNASPVSPSPGQTVRMEVSTPTFDKNTAFFEWTIDGSKKTEFSGVGKNTLSLTAPTSVGARMAVSVAVTQLSGGQNTVALTLRVADLSLVWRAHTYIPPWYQGKALPVQSTQIDVIALPDFVNAGDRILPKNLIYQWTLDDNDPENRELGAQVFSFPTSQFPNITHSIHVIVEDVDGTIHKEGQIYLTPTAPKALLYSASPLGGIESRTSASVYAAAARGILDFMVEPFFFPVSRGQTLRYQWRVDQQPVAGSPDTPSLLTIDTSSSRLNETIPIAVTIGGQSVLMPTITGSFILKLPPQ